MKRRHRLGRLTLSTTSAAKAQSHDYPDSVGRSHETGTNRSDAGSTTGCTETTVRGPEPDVGQWDVWCAECVANRISLTIREGDPRSSVGLILFAKHVLPHHIHHIDSSRCGYHRTRANR